MKVIGTVFQAYSVANSWYSVTSKWHRLFEPCQRIMPRIFITLQGQRQHVIISYLFFCLTTERFDKMFSNCSSELISNPETLNSRLSSEERMKIYFTTSCCERIRFRKSVWYNEWWLVSRYVVNIRQLCFSLCFPKFYFYRCTLGLVKGDGRESWKLQIVNYVRTKSLSWD